MLDKRLRLKNDLEFYARNCLFIRTKGATIEPFYLNKAQKYIHERLEAQKEKTGKVRALILKGRQQGCSTYVGARFYHLTTHSMGVRTFILTHEEQATQNLFDMVNRYHERCPEFVKPITGAANAKELFFDKLDSGYKVGTAGSKGVGRSSTVQLFHGSEVAFWPNAQEHAAGVLQAVPDTDGTEVILESTAKGMGNFFHQKWQDAEKGDGDFIAIFVPWFWQDEYQKAVPDDFQLNESERAYMEAYDLTLEQMSWRRTKMRELGEVLFKQEYPAFAGEAFQMTGHDSFIKPELVSAARKFECDGVGQLIIGYDPAWMGDDRSSMAFRKGRKVLKIESRLKLDTMQGAGWAKHVIDTEKPAKMFIDVGGIGAGIYDRLMEMGYGNVVSAVNFGSSPFETSMEGLGGAANRRAEMWLKSREWLSDVAGASIPDSDGLQADACAPSYRFDSSSRLLIESKDAMRKRGVRSPDEWDAVALTFAEPINPWANQKLNYPNLGLI